MYKFRNIDSFKPGLFERVGMLKGKRWYTDYSNVNHPKNGLFKPKRFEFGDKKVFCANHYGEFIGYLLARNAHTPSCPAELAILTNYYPHIHKEKNGGTPVEKKGCIIYSLLGKKDILEPGSIVIENLPELRRKYKSEDDIELFLEAVEQRTRNFYDENSKTNRNMISLKQNSGNQNELSKDYVENRVKNNRLQAIEMIIYDCLYGNNDRHTDNWSMVQIYDNNRADIALYPLYDNERVLGLYENQYTVESVLESKNSSKKIDDILFSRMRVPGEKNKFSNYRDVLTYIMHKYPEEAARILERHLKTNTPEKVNTFLRFCDGLPTCYIDFANSMYKDRYFFAKELLEKKKNFKDKQSDDMYKIDFGKKEDKQEEFVYFRRTIAPHTKIGYAEEPSK